MAYFCRQFAMEKGLVLRGQDNSPETNQFLLTLMNKLEQDKAAMPSPPTKEMGKATVTQFAMDVFAKADQEDRAELADANTARTFYAAGIFFDVLNQFGTMDTEINMKRKYAKWKSADILKAIKEGRPVVPGGPEEQAENTLESTGLPPQVSDVPTDQPLTPHGSDMNDSALLPGHAPPAYVAPLHPAPQYQPPVSTPSQHQPDIPQPSAPPVYQQPLMPQHVPRHVPQPVADPAPYRNPSQPTMGKGNIPAEQIADAIEYAKFAIRALETREVNLGIDRLSKALSVLQRR